MQVIREPYTARQIPGLTFAFDVTAEQVTVQGDHVMVYFTALAAQELPANIPYPSTSVTVIPNLPGIPRLTLTVEEHLTDAVLTRLLPLLERLTGEEGRLQHRLTRSLERQDTARMLAVRLLDDLERAGAHSSLREVATRLLETLNQQQNFDPDTGMPV